MPKCVLAVDDDRMVRELIKHTLEAKGYEVIPAQNGQEALDFLNTKIPDLIMLDVQMPVMDGYTFIMKKWSDPAFNKIPVVVLSALAKTEPLFKRYGVKAYLLKPINTQDLLEKIQSIVPA